MPSPRPLLREHLTYANVAASLAVVLALSGTAYAAGLPKNSVASKQIKNDSVSTKDLKNGSVSGTDLKGDSLTGAQVDESTLGAVPQALVALDALDSAKLGGRPAAEFRRAGPFISGSALNGVPLELVVSGYGSYRIACDTGGSPLTDDEPIVGYANGMGAGTRVFARIAAAPDGSTAADVRVIAGTASTNIVSYTHRDDSVDFDLYFRSADGTKAIHVYGIAADDPAIAGCAGFITADVIA
jgi:hypothetical protein